MHFGMLGSLAAWTSAGHLVEVAQPKVRGLLAALLLAGGRVVSIDRLADELWGARLPANPDRALHTKVWQLRQALEKAEPGAGVLVVARRPGYLLAAEPDMVDAHRFAVLRESARRSADPRERATLLTEALGLWRGDVLGDFADRDFAAAVVTRLEEQRLDAVESRAEALLELGEHAELTGELAEIVHRHPLRERLRGAYIRALYRSGRQSEALRNFDELRVLLAEQLGVDPGPELDALRQAILEQRPELSPATPASLAVPSVARPRTNLPAQLTELIGRDRAGEQVRGLLASSRLVTLGGIGGVGKTRLALAVAAAVAPAYADGVWLVELGRLGPASPSEAPDGSVVELVAQVLGVRDALSTPDLPPEPRHAGREGLAGRLVDAVHAKRMLLVLDNCEHVVWPAAQLAEMLLKAAPELHILATSREPLGVTGERMFPLAPLDLPAAGTPVDAATLARSSAVALFVARTSEVVPGFTLDDSKAAAVHTICSRLDGIPFALELAATRVRTLGVQEVADRLDDRFRLLTTGARDAPRRHQTLRATIDWSWDLLSDAERVILRRVSVTRGGCSLAAIESICADEQVDHDDVVDIVARLVDRSLIAMTDGPAGARYHLLESVHAYSAERLAEAGETVSIQRQHLRYFVDFAERAHGFLHGPQQQDWLARLDAELANMRCGLEYAVQLGAATSALRLVNASAWYWFLRGRLGEANRAIAAALAIEPGTTSVERVRATAWYAGFALRAGDRSYSLARCEAALREFETVDDAPGAALASWFLGYAQTGFGEHPASAELANRSLAEFTRRGDRWGMAVALGTLATLAVLQGDLAAVESHGKRSVALFEALGDGWGLLHATGPLAQLAEARGDYERAADLHRAGLLRAQQGGLWTEVSVKLSGLGRIALLTGDYVCAGELHADAARLAADLGYTFGVQFAEVGLALGFRRQGDLDAAEPYLWKWLEWCRRLEGNIGSALILAELGFLAELRDDAETATRLHDEGFAAATSSGDPRAIALALEGSAGAQSIAGNPQHAALLLGAAASLRDSVGATLPAGERGDVDRISARTAAALGARDHDRAYTRGRGLDPDAARRLTRLAPTVTSR
ncbi:BTAD domain-containing putative transcriptional regulator [Winogradskya consettensis]|uniref:SARP family transcriptional regulator n=1 Tax=Winogradskya consettensis TaxID=113560 RepID=A0A919W627_9ACTN|nr:BTAD domain-containing putative transcriptional regulator [Actinoplanes consettensis]GIM82011.1 SARP family transcriptional regulator [Actinoplanes consettensis]